MGFVDDTLDLKMTLGENSLDSLEESLRKVDEANEHIGAWKFAVVHVVHAIELMLKERLRREHALLVYQNVDKIGSKARPGLTVSLEVALSRLQNAGVELDLDDTRAIRKAIEWRNGITHSEFTLSIPEVRTNYALLFEFVHSFYLKEFGADVVDLILEPLRPVATEVMEVFREEFVVFQGNIVHRSWPSSLLAAQEIQVVWLNGRSHRRYRYGEEPMWALSEYGPQPVGACHDCSCLPGQFHGSYCDMEQCPCCEEQFLSCDCEPEADDSDESFLKGDVPPDRLSATLSPDS